MNDDILRRYLDEIQQENSPETVAKQYYAQHEKSALSPLFEGEIAYFNTNYSAALKAYLRVKTHALSPYFCYRAAACLHWQRGEIAEAKEKAKQAQEIFPSDPNLREIHLSEKRAELRGIFEKNRTRELFASEPAKATPKSSSSSCPLQRKIKESLDKGAEWIQQLGERSKEPLPYTLKSYGQCSLDPYLTRLLPFSAPSSYTLRSAEFGIVLNPGRGFVRRFLESGEQLESINAAFLTRGDILTFGDTLALLRLKAEAKSAFTLFAPQHLLQRIQSNLVCCEENTLSFAALPSEGERSYCLSPDLTVELFAPPRGATAEGALYRYAAKATLQFPGGSVQIGHCSGLSFSRELSEWLSSSDILIAGVGKVSLHDVAQGALSCGSLGYSGAKRLIEESRARLTFVDEVYGSFGDLRLEMTRALRKQLPTESIVLPALPTLTYNLKKELVQNSCESEAFAPKEARIIRSATDSAVLYYSSAKDIL